ncbi:MAG: hypothetical protein REI78_08730 [Pedobacter sp.]|nr:hypothetical protein [Pedobacter sp.]
MKEKLELRQIRDFGTVIGDIFVFIRQNIKPLLKSYFSICGIFLLGGLISLVIFKIQAQQIQGRRVGTGIFSNSMSGMLFTWEYLLMILFSILSYVSMYVTVLSFIALYIEKGNVAPNTNEVWSYFRYYFFRVFGSSIGLGLLLVICFAVCLLPGIYVFPAFTLFFPVMMLENGSFSHSFERSFKLLSGEWWVSAATILVIYFIFYVTSMIVQLPTVILEMVSTLSHTESAIKSLYTLFAAIFTCLAQIFVLIPIIGSALIYFNLIERKESIGLLGRINNFGSQGPVHDHPEEY